MGAADAETDLRREFERGLSGLRPKLHRYCARMTGSVFDGEDVLQEALAKAATAFDESAPPASLEPWLLTIAHNAAIDFLRRRARNAASPTEEEVDMIADAAPTPEDRLVAATQMRAFMALSVMQRGCVILMDVLGYSLREIADMLCESLPGVKAALHRGRARLRVAAAAPDDRPPTPLTAAERSLLARYVDRFNARDFDAVRDMLAVEAHLDMVARTHMNGAAEICGRYLYNYDKAHDWRLSLGLVDGRPALLVCDPGDPTGAVAYFVQLVWADGRLKSIRDFRYARYVTDGATVAEMTFTGEPT
jgi:RNA polymerase sigma-70 factor (ECF subfamily)